MSRHGPPTSPARPRLLEEIWRWGETGITESPVTIWAFGGGRRDPPGRATMVGISPQKRTLRVISRRNNHHRHFFFFPSRRKKYGVACGCLVFGWGCVWVGPLQFFISFWFLGGLKAKQKHCDENVTVVPMKGQARM